MTDNLRCKVVARLCLVLLAASLLAGCSGGLSGDALRGRQADATRESVVTDLQATHTWNIVHGTPESTPAPDEGMPITAR